MTINSTRHDVNFISKSLQYFGIIDYSIFIIMLVVCSMIGIYFGYKDHKKLKRNQVGSKSDSDALNYLVGGRNLQEFPVAMSLIASFISGISLLGMSTEVYLYGFQYTLILISIFIMTIFVYFVTIPVYSELNITSTYEYLEIRFDKKVRSLCSLMFSVASMLWMPIVIFVPALAFNQVTGINIHIVSPIVCLVCIFYTLLGGMKAVIWTDFFQIIIMYGTLLIIIVKGTIDVGGLSEVISRNAASGRLEMLVFDMDPTLRFSFWTLMVGGAFHWINVNASNQQMVQRFLSLSSAKSARRALIIYAVGISIIVFMCCYNGILIYATYYDCDPIQTGLAKAKDQVLPLLVMDIFKNIPGLSGLFIAGVFSAALSSLSTGLNSMSAVVLEDFFKSHSKRPLTDLETSIIMRGTVFIAGIISVALVYVVQNLGSVLQLSMSVPAACFGPMLGAFIIGMFLPWINARGTLFGLITSLLVISYIVFRSQADIALGLIKFETKPFSTEGCAYDFVAKNKTVVEGSEEYQKSLHNISYLYYTAFGSVVTCLMASIYCAIFGFNDISTIDESLLAPIIRKYVKAKPKPRKMMSIDEYSSISLEDKL